MGKVLVLIVWLVALSSSEALDLTNIHAVQIDGKDFLEFRRVTSAAELKTYLDEITNEFIVPSNFHQIDISTIQRLLITNSSLAEIPTSVFNKFENLLELNADNVGLESFDVKFSAKKLKSLSLANNKLKNYGNLMLQDLKTLDLSGNELEIESLTFSPAISINLSRNKLRKVAISRLLTHLNIAENRIEKIVIPRDSQLEVLNLSRNALETEDLLQLRDLRYLETLDLSECGLTSLNFDSFAHLESLVTLKLEKNAITGFNFGVFAHQRMLTTLNLSGNSITNIDLYHFEALVSLTSLDISFNNISQLEGHESLRSIFLKNLREIHIEGNPWECKYLSILNRSFQSQLQLTYTEYSLASLKGLDVKTPTNPVKNRPNIQGIECIEKSPEAVSNEADIPKKISEIEMKFNALEQSLETLSRWMTVAYMIGILCVAFAAYKFVKNTFFSNKKFRRSLQSTNPFEQEQLNNRQ